MLGNSMKWKRIAYFLVGAVFTPIFLGLALLLLTLRPHHSFSVGIYGTSTFFCVIAILTASAFRAAFRNPPWWIISPDKTSKSNIFLIRRQMLVVAKKRMKLAEKSLKLAEKNLKLAEQLEELEKAQPFAGGNAAPPRAQLDR
jgi:hypothetical protein